MSKTRLDPILIAAVIVACIVVAGATAFAVKRSQGTAPAGIQIISIPIVDALSI